MTPDPQRENVEGPGFFIELSGKSGGRNVDPEGPCPHGPEPAMENLRIPGPSGDGPSGHARVRPQRDTAST